MGEKSSRGKKLIMSSWREMEVVGVELEVEVGGAENVRK